MPMKMQADTLRRELKQILGLLTSWDEKLEAGIPGDELPSNDLNADIYQYQLRGELMLAAERLTALVEVLES